MNRIANPGRGRAANLRGNRGGNRFGNRGQSARCTTRQRRQGIYHAVTQMYVLYHFCVLQESLGKDRVKRA